MSRSNGGVTGPAPRIVGLVIAFLAAAPGVARAQPAPARPSDAPLPSCLDQSIRDQLGAELKPRGVQKRDFKKDGKIV
ncbi:MAG TPA: hypothetical protein VK932_20950, partial [Kofleriaceae bacterium]|nr:hypothetical protein [Kofleriaceae bacterium]